MLLPDQIEEVALNLKNGKVTLLPTQTLWGLSCDAFNQEAIGKISKLTKRPQGQPYILLVSSLEMLIQYTTHIHPRIETLLSFHKKPMTLIHQALNLPDYLIAKDGTVAIRITFNPLCQAIIEALGNPIISTSANRTGEAVASKFTEIDKKIKDGIDFLPPYTQSTLEQLLENPSVIARYDADGEMEFIRT
jgi:L-threonylcarbamoyladenylate synthase